MRPYLLLITLILAAIDASAQQNDDCSWLEELETIEDIGSKLSLLQKNFGNCTLVVVDGHPVSSDTSTFYFGNLKIFIEQIRERDIDSFNVLKGKAARTLYGHFDSVIIISFKSEKTKYKIQKRVTKRLKKEN